MNKFLKIIKNNVLIIASVLFFANTMSADALQIVYPKSQSMQVCAGSTFFVGNTTPDSKLTINGKEVKVYENGSFVEVVPLNDGINTIKINSQNETENVTFTYTIKKVAKTNPDVQEPETEEFPANEYIYSSIVKDHTPLRAQPDENAKRITHLDHNTILMLNGKKGDYYRVSLTPGQNAWVKSSNIVNYSTITEKMLASATSVTLTEDKLYNYIKTDLSFQVPFVVTETDKGLNLELYSVKDNPAHTTIFKPLGEVKSFAINNVSTDATSSYYIELKNRLWGYNAYYEGNTLVLKIRKKPELNSKQPLKDITIAIDAGHGGCDSGAIGPTAVKEKDINLDISKRLQTILEKSGATVVMTRTDDSTVDLYERPKKAQDADALIMVSIHANALPDGADPYAKHGTSVFYYNAEAVELAKVLRDTLTKDLATRDDGVCKASYVLTRPTMPLSVLVEVAYMIHPYEYTLLLDENFRQSAAESIEKGIRNYILDNVK